MRLGRAAAAALCAFVLVPAAAASAPPPPTIPQAFNPVAEAERPRLNEEQAVARFLARGKVADWVARYPQSTLATDATFDKRVRSWEVKVWSPRGGEIATGRVDDLTGFVTEAWTGPQVAWTMARGVEGAFGGKDLNSPVVWLAFCAVFFLGLADLRRPLSLRNLDLLVLLSFTASLFLFSEGRIFASVPLVYPPLVYLLGRAGWIGLRGRPPAAARPLWPVWLLAAATVFLMGFRIGLEVEDSNVIDVGYSGVIGAHRIAHGEAPYGHMPVEAGKPCAPADREGRQAYRIQTNGRCEAQNARGDTYGPVSYQAYLPGYAAFGWKGYGDDLDAARFTAVLFDVLCILGLALVGRRFGGNRLMVTLAFAWAAYPFTQFMASAGTNDALVPAFLIWGFWLASSAWARGTFVALASWTKFAPLLLVPLWATYPDVRGRLRPKVVFGVAFVLTTLAGFWILLLESDPLHAARVFWDRTLAWQVGRDSPFSIWGWGQYHAEGIPDLGALQAALEVLVVLGAVGVAFVPRRKSPLQLAALTAAVLIGFELVLTHWFYPYLPWFFPFVAFALLSPAAAPVAAEAPELIGEREAGELAPAG